jgi:hypothetical protein
MALLVEGLCRISPIEFHKLVESMPRCIEAVLARGDPMAYKKTLHVGLSFILAVTCI